jgi:TRAP-type C4-dicarboxylate transport system substrate-binding protein
MFRRTQQRWLRSAFVVGALLATALLGGATRAEPVTLRMASVAPDGTAWAREVRAFAREIESATGGDVHVKWYLGGIAGDEAAELDRLRRGLLDGIGGSSFCERLAPSMQVIHVIGLYNDRAEVAYVLRSLKPLFDEEFKRSGSEELATSVFGGEILFSRQPVHTLADFRRLRWWTWDSAGAVQIWRITMPEMGAHTVPGRLEDVAPLYTQGQVDGFIAVPSVALGFQWSPLASYYSDLKTAMVPACLVVASSALDPLPLNHQRAIRAAGAKLQLRWDDVTATLDTALTEGLFEKQGLKRVNPSNELRSEFFAAARHAREVLGDRLVARALLERVEALINEYRVNRPHAQAAPRR